MANLLVYIDVRDGEITAPSRFAAAEARRLADTLGATVYALVTIQAAADEVIDGLARALGAGGADRVLCCVDAAVGPVPFDATAGPILTAVAQRLRPLVTLFPAGIAGPDLGPPLSIRTGAMYHPRVSLEIVEREDRRGQERPRLVIKRWRRPHDGLRVVDVRELGHPVVVTVMAGDPPAQSLGEPAAEVDILTYPAGVASVLEELSSEPDDQAGADVASTMVFVQVPADDRLLTDLRAQLPSDAVAVTGTDAENTLLDAACPARLLLLAPASDAVTTPPVSIAPSTRLLIAGGKNTEKLPVAEAVWRNPKEDFVSKVASALPGFFALEEEAAES